MGNGLVALGLFAWLMSSILSYVFFTPQKERLIKRLIKSVKIRFINSTGPEFGISLFQITAVFWVLIGLIINIFDRNFLYGMNGDIILGILFLAPVLIGAIVAERRRKGHSR